MIDQANVDSTSAARSQPASSRDAQPEAFGCEEGRRDPGDARGDEAGVGVARDVAREPVRAVAHSD